MPQQVEVDFRGAPPSQGGGRGDFIAPGYYRMVVSRMINTVTKTQPTRTMYVTWLTVEGGEFDGRTRPEYFVMPLPEDRDDKKMMGLPRFHAFVNACGWTPGEKKVKFDLDALINRRIMALVGEQPEKDQKGEETGKMEPKFSAFDPLPKAEPVAPATNGNGTAKAAAAAVATAPTAVAEPDVEKDDAVALDESAAADETPTIAAAPAVTPARAARAPRAAATPTPAPTPAPTVETGEEDDDEVEELFN